MDLESFVADLGAFLATAFQMVGQFLPATIAVALVLFVFREFLEFRRRGRANRRKVSAIKHAFARDLELCNWAIKTYRVAIEAIEQAETTEGHQVHVIADAAGRLRLEHWDAGQSVRSGFPLAAVANPFSPQLMLEIATLDETLHKQAEKAADDLAELEHIRTSILTQVADPINRAGFVDYARSVLDEIQTDLSAFYRSLTGQQELKPRVR